MKNWLIAVLLPLAVAAAWDWSRGGDARKKLAALLVNGILKLEDLIGARFPWFNGDRRREANAAMAAELRETADELDAKQEPPKAP